MGTREVARPGVKCPWDVFCMVRGDVIDHFEFEHATPAETRKAGFFFKQIRHVVWMSYYCCTACP